MMMRIHACFDNIPTGVLIADKTGRVIYTNKYIKNMLCDGSDDHKIKSLNELLPERYVQKHGNYVKKYFNNPESRLMGTGRELFAKRTNGTEIPVEIGLSPIEIANKQYVIATIIDITYRKEAEELIKESENKLEAILNNSPDVILVYRDDGKIVKFNNEGKKLLQGRGLKKISNIFDTISIENKNLFKNKLDEVKKGKEVKNWETNRIFVGGKQLPSSVSLVYVQDNGGLYIETIRDITQSVNLRNKILEYEKAGIVAKMAEGIAHHMGTPITSILLRIQMLKEDICNLDEEKKLFSKLDSIEKQIMHCKDVMQRLLRFSANTSGEKSKTELTILLSNAIETILPLSEKKGIKTSLECRGKIYVYGDRNLLELVFTDIMMNAIDAMNSGGDLKVKLRLNKSVVDIDFEDTGDGIEIDVLPHVFEPFFTTKPSGEGTGLGLAVAKRIINDHNGRITITSVKDKGTTAKVSLPVYGED